MENHELRKENEILKQEKQRTLREIDNLREQIASLNDECSKLKKRVFCLGNLSEDHSISFYTGFPNVKVFEANI